MILYDCPLLADGYAVRLLFAFLDLTVETRWIEIHPIREDRSPAFLAISPEGRLPVLDADGRRIDDWIDILRHLALAHDPSHRWLPDPVAAAPWLGVARTLGDTAGRARLGDGLAWPGDCDGLRAEAHRTLRRIEARLWWQECEGHAWLLPGDHPTIVDLAIFAHAALSEEGGISHMDYPALRRWFDRVRRLPGFVVTSGIFDLPALESVS